MSYCENCGAIVSEHARSCETCGAQIGFAGIGEQQGRAYNESLFVTTKKNIWDFVQKYVPQKLLAATDKTLFFAGLGCFGALALVYILCMFSFMADICLPIGLGSEAFLSFVAGAGWDSSGASALWILIFLIVNLVPAAFVALAFSKNDFRRYCLYALAGFIILTVFSLFAWLISSPGSMLEAITYYSSPNKYAWYVLMDSLSEVWYLKLILCVGAAVGIGVDIFKDSAIELD
ncbi:MAG: zinc ribbon domain-containing protein [Clostridia bacterium]|nr:zinc ribbon domain-containing protein [Clostridia bacterium]